MTKTEIEEAGVANAFNNLAHLVGKMTAGPDVMIAECSDPSELNEWSQCIEESTTTLREHIEGLKADPIRPIRAEVEAAIKTIDTCFGHLITLADEIAEVEGLTVNLVGVSVELEEAKIVLEKYFLEEEDVAAPDWTDVAPVPKKDDGIEF